MDTTFESRTGKILDERDLMSRVSARAVGAGVIVALITQLMMTLLGLAIGLTAFEPRANVARGIGVGFGIWLLLSFAVSSLLGAWVASSAARSRLRRDGLLNGVVAWALASLLGLFLVGGATRTMLGGALGVAQAPAPAVTSSLGRAASEIQTQVQRPGAPIAARTDQAATGTAIGMWWLFLAHLIGLGGALVGGSLGTSTERKLLATRPIYRTPTPSTPVPQPT